MLLYKQSTAATLIVGPILDSTGAEYSGAVIGDLSISKNGGSLTALAATATLTHIANGQYTLVLTTGNTDTIGRAQITCNKSTYQMPMAELMVLQGTTFDALVTNAAGDANGMLYNGSNTGAVIPTVTTLTNLPAITSNWLTAAGLAADAVTEIQSGLSTLDASGVRAAVGMAAADLDTQLDAILAAADASSGTGSTVVTEDYPTANNLRAVDSNGAGIHNCVIRAYLTTDYDARNTGASFVQATTTTDTNGDFSQPMSLDPGSYTLVYSGPDGFSSTTKALTVS